MENKMTLKKLFESHKDELSLQLTGLTLPRDAQKIQLVVSNYLNGLFDSDGEFRQNLTQSEDYILEAAMSLLNAQQAMVQEFSTLKFAETLPKSDYKPQSGGIPSSDLGSSLKKEHYPYVVGGTTVGGAAGALIFGTWGAVFGSIAGTALVLYYSSQLPKSFNKSNETLQKSRIEAKTDVREQKIDVEVFTNIVGSICDSVDSLILTFRTQINRVVEKYENQEKPVLEKEYGVLLDSIQSILGAGFQPADEKRQKRIDSRIEQLAESLENYDLEVVKYSDNSKNYFEITSSDKAEEPIMVLPAIVKHGIVIRKGKVLVKD